MSNETTWTVTEREGHGHDARYTMTRPLLANNGKAVGVITAHIAVRINYVSVGFTVVDKGRLNAGYSQAEAARLVATCADTVGDLAFDDPFDVEIALNPGAIVTVAGEGALVIVAPALGNEVAEVVL